MTDHLTIEDQIRLLELGIEINILTEAEITRLRELGIISTESDSANDTV
jgi:hypothetical protein